MNTYIYIPICVCIYTDTQMTYDIFTHITLQHSEYAAVLSAHSKFHIHVCTFTYAIYDMYMYVIHIHICIYIYIYTYIHLYVYVYTYIYIYMHTPTYRRPCVRSKLQCFLRTLNHIHACIHIIISTQKI